MYFYNDLEIRVRAPRPKAGWLEVMVPPSVMERLWNYIDEAKDQELNPDMPNINVNHSLAGNITESLALRDRDDWFWQECVLDCVTKFEEEFPEYIQSSCKSFMHDAFSLDLKDDVTGRSNLPYVLDTLWVNFQRKHEFNPPHNHSGVFSFVVWMQIPTDWRDQHSIAHVNHANSPKASDFDFRYIDLTGEMVSHTYLLDKESNGVMLFFPSALEHNVYPFYECDDVRVSISGNIKFDAANMHKFLVHPRQRWDGEKDKVKKKDKWEKIEPQQLKS